MSEYKGKTVRVDLPSDVIAEKFADLSTLNSQLDKIPEEQRSQMGDLSFTTDSIIINNPAVGRMAFRVARHTPEKVVFKADGMIPLTIDIDLKPVADGTATDVTTVLDIEIPMMLRPIIGGKLQQVADSFGDLIGRLAAPGAQS